MRISAPGKLFLTGEYAVLWGAPAAIAAVSPRLSATLERSEKPEVTLQVPGGVLQGAWREGKLEWTGPTAPARFAQRALELGLGSEAVGLQLSFARGARGPRGQKLGLGSSASAATIAAAAGLLVRDSSAHVEPDRVFPLAAQAHWEVQGGKGSNGDVAAACYGGVIRYLRYPVEKAAAERPPRPDVTPLAASGLYLALVFSGRSAQTPSMVSAVERALTSAEREAFTARSAELTEAFCSALREGRGPAVVQALNAAGDLLAELGKRAGVEVVTPELEKIQALGREAGLGAKVSGAGGGDGALFASFERTRLRAALGEARARGFETFELQIAPGIRVDAGARSR